MCVHNMTRPSPAKAKTLNRSPRTSCRSTRYPKDAKCVERNSPMFRSDPVTDGIDINVFVNSNGFIRQTTRRSAARDMPGRERLRRGRGKIHVHRKENAL